MTSKAFWIEYFEDAYREASVKRREVLDRALLLIAHLIREELPGATAISVNGPVVTAVHDDTEVIWQLSDETRGKLSGLTLRHIRDTLLDTLSFHTAASLLAADWKQVNELTDTLRVALPEDPDRKQDGLAGADGPLEEHQFTVDCTTYGPYPAARVRPTWGAHDPISVTRETAERIAEDLNVRDAGCGLTAVWQGDSLVFTWDERYRNDGGGSETVTPDSHGRYLIGGLWPWERLEQEQDTATA
ncbi:hypothetical protein ACFXKY_15435 [Streptomyces canus]|uniref:hypothetical protein n=1 Tax=Streptomyces canus TaxID=58343 RepID=UPI0036756966